MAEITYNDQLTVLEQAQLIGPDGGILTIAELLNQENELMMDAVAQMANGIRAHVTAVRTDLPQIFPRKINQGSTTKYPQSKQIEDQIMLLEAWPKIDEQLVDPYPDPKKARASQLRSYIEAFAQAFNQNLFYGNAGDVGEIDGFSTIYNDSSMANVDVTASGAGSDTTSIWLAEWNTMKLSLIYPKDSKSVGLFNKDWGKKESVDASNGGSFAAYVSQMKMEFGWSNADARALQRLANIETDISTADTGSLLDTDEVRKLVAMRNRLPKRGKGKVAMYANRDLFTQFDIWAMEKVNGFYYESNISGSPLTMFQGIPIRLVEQLSSTETAIS